MTDEITKTAEQLETENKMSEAERRIRQLSEKVRLTSEERDEKDNLLKERDETIASLQRENSFNSGFTDTLSTYPAAKDYKDKIKEKVTAGYSLEDATLAVLGKEGKLGGTLPAPESPPNPAGGSASNLNTPGGEKPIADMTQEERRAKLAEQITWQ